MSSEILYQGKVISLRTNPFSLLIFPFVHLKKLLKILYDALARLIWAELVRGEKQNNEIMNLIAFFAFCALAWGTYFLQNYTKVIFIISLMIWSIDWGFAITSYSHPKSQYAVKLLRTEGGLTLRSQSPQTARIDSEIALESLKNLYLQRIDLKGGAFGHAIGQPWQLHLTLKDGSDYLLDQHRDLSTILEKAQTLATILELPLIFVDSYGNSCYAAQPLAQFAIATQKPVPSIQLRKSPKTWQVKTRWGWGNSWLMIQQIFKSSGFLLFLLFLSNFMVKLGEFINGFVAENQGQDRENLIDIAPSLTPQFDFWDGMDIFIVVAIILYNGWKFSQIKRVIVDRIFVKYLINRKTIERVRTEKVNALLLINAIDPELLVIASHKAISFGHFHRPIESVNFLESLAEAIQHFRPDLQEEEQA